MGTPEIKPELITKPIQLLAVWLAGLVILAGVFLTAATQLADPPWLRPFLAIAAVFFVPLFLGLIFLLQTKFRPQLQEDRYYATYLEHQLNERASADLTTEVQSRVQIEGHAGSIEVRMRDLREVITMEQDPSQSKRAEAQLEALQASYALLLHDVTHSLKTLLHAVLLSAQRLRREVSRDHLDPRLLAELADRISDHVDNFSHLLDTIRFQIPYDLRGSLAAASLRVYEDLLCPVVLSLRTQAATKKIDIALDAHPLRTTVRGDGRALQTAIYNIVQNAIKYGDPGCPISIAHTEKREGVEISVTSQGVTIPPDELPHIFEAGYRSRSAAMRDPVGMGIGLFASRQILTMHGGTIDLRTAPPRTTVVSVFLPAAQAADA